MSRPHRTQGRDSIQRNRLPVVLPQCSQCWGPRIARRSRQPAQVSSKLRVSYSWRGWIRTCRHSGDRVPGGLDSRSTGSNRFADSEAPWPPDGGIVSSCRRGQSSGSILPRQGYHFRPSRQGYLGRERPPQGVLSRCKLRNTPAPAPGRKKGGSLPSTSAFPVRARRSRECGRNCMSDNEIGEIGGVSQKASGMELGSFVSLTLPDRARNPSFQRSKPTSCKPARTPDHEACRKDHHGGLTAPDGRRLPTLAS